MSATDRSWSQRDRQQYRSGDGRYAQTHPCYRCGMNATAHYFSDRRTDAPAESTSGIDFADAVLCLCVRCAEYTDTLTDLELDAEIKSPGWGHLPRPRKRRT